MHKATKIYVLRLIVLAAGYTAVAYLSLFLVPKGIQGASIVWPASAIGLASLFLFGIELWPALLVPFFALLVARGVPPPTAAIIAGGDMLEAVVGTLILQRLQFRAMFDRLQDALTYGFASVLAALFSATVITAGLHLFGHLESNELLWMGLWIGHLVSLLTFGTFAMRWGYKPHFTRTWREWLEGVPLFALFTVTTVLTYWTSFSSLGSISLLYVSIIPLIWCALRAGPRGITLCLMLMALIAATGALWGFGPLAHAVDQRQVLFSVQLIVGVLSVIFLLFTSIVEERKEAVIALRANVERLQTAVEQIKQEDQAKADFIAILAHELRNPLSPILSSLEIMKINGISPDNAPAVASMASNVHVMARLLDDLLDMSRITQKKFKLQREPVKLGAVIAHSLEMATAYVDERSHTLTIVEPEEDLWVNGDPVRLAQIVVNLLTNAAKYTDQGGRIRLEAKRVGNNAIIEVSDNGIGIDAQRLKKIFEPFGANDTGVRRAGGLHIGLSLAKRMAELHNGNVSVQSQGEGRGSTFVVTLPLMNQAPLLNHEQAGTPKRSRFSRDAFGRSKTLGVLDILVVDDNEAAADSLAQLLRHNGHQTKVAYDAPQALELCEGYEPAVALLDIGLPTMTGYELAARLRDKFGEDIMLVALTGYGQAEDKQKARDAGFDEHLTKPVSIVDVERVLLELSRS